MSKYKYTKKNLLIHREDYMYSSFLGLEFLSAYIKDRDYLINKRTSSQFTDSLIDRFQEELSNQIKKRKFNYSNLKLFLIKNKIVDKEKQRGRSIKDSKFIFTNNLFKMIISSKIDKKNKKVIKYIDKFLTKFEVSKQIDEKYNLLFKRVNSSHLNLDIYANFALILCLTYIKFKNLRYLNCLLKINDLIVSQQKLDVNTLTKIKLSLLLEKVFVINLFNRNKIKIKVN